MSGAGKKVADVAFKASRTIDWEGMAKVLVTDEARREFSNLRRAFDEVNTQLQTKFSQVRSSDWFPFSSNSFVQIVIWIIRNFQIGVGEMYIC